MNSRFKADGEYRFVSVLFADIANFTKLSTKYNAEDIKLLLDQYYSICEKVIKELDGYVAQYLGDGILVYFGYPHAHEDDARRAINAGLKILKNRNLINSLSDNNLIDIYIGIHSGEVFVEKNTYSKNARAYGIIPNIASRLCEKAKKNELLISQQTFDLVGAFFEIESVGTHKLKGVRNKLELYKVKKPLKAVSRFQNKLTRKLTPFISREKEILKITESLTKKNKSVAIEGEAGIGKSRLVYELKKLILDRGYQFVESQCLEYYSNTPFYPIIEFLKNEFEILEISTDRYSIEKIRSKLSEFDLNTDKNVYILCILLSLRIPKKYKQSDENAVLRENIIELVVNVIEKVLFKKILIIEDVHWSDPSTLEVLSLLINANHGRILFTYRPELKMEFKKRSLTIVKLKSFKNSDSRKMIESIVQDHEFSFSDINRIIEKTDGIPLYIEEYTNHFIQFNGYSGSLGIHPASLAQTLLAKIDRYDEFKNLIHIAAALGREIDPLILKQVSKLGNKEFNIAIDNLISNDLFFLSSLENKRVIIFKHSLIRDAIYNSITSRKKRDIHSEIVKIIESRHKNLAKTNPEFLANHANRAGYFDISIDYYIKAAENAIKKSSYYESINYYKTALEITKQLQKHQRLIRELEILADMSSPLVLTQGWGTEEVYDTYIKANKISKKLNDVEKRSEILYWQSPYYIIRAKFRTSIKCSNELIKNSKKENRESWRFEGELWKGVVLVCLGKLLQAEKSFEKNLSGTYSLKYVNNLDKFKPEVFVCGNGFRAWNLSLLGENKKAVGLLEKVNQIVDKLNHNFGLNLCKSYIVILHQLIGNYEKVETLSLPVISESKVKGYPHPLAIAKLLNSYSKIKLGKSRKVNPMLDAIDIWQSTGAVQAIPWIMTLLAESYLEIGKYKNSLEYIDYAKDQIKQTSEIWYQPELYRIKSLVLFKMNKKNESETSLNKSIQISREIGAVALEKKALATLDELRF